MKHNMKQHYEAYYRDMGRKTPRKILDEFGLWRYRV